MNNFLRHCWHPPNDDRQFNSGEHDTCCWCDVGRYGSKKPAGHGPYYKGQGDSIDRTDDLCPTRPIKDDDFTSYGR